MTTGAQLEALQERRRLARAELEKDSHPALAQLAHEMGLFKTALARVERGAVRSTSQRVAMFGFLIIFVGPIIAMFGTALGRLLRNETWAAVLCLAGGVAVVLVVVVPTLSTRVLHSTSRQWRLLERAVELSRER